MNIILTVNKNWACDENLIFSKKLRGNNLHFNELTNGKIVVFDEELLNKLKNINLKNKMTFCYSPNNVKKEEEPITDLKTLFEKLSFYNKDNVFVIGGVNFQKEVLPYCEKAYITKTEETIKKENVIVNLDKNENWELIKTSDPIFEDGVVYYFCEYVNKKPLKFNWGYEEDDLI